MARPEKFDDLDDYTRAPREFVKIDPQHLTVDVHVGSAVLALIDAARQSDVFVVDEEGVFTVSLPLTQKERDSRLRSAQGDWDTCREGYEEALSGAELPSWRRYSIDQWARREGRDPIDWDAIAVEAVA